MSASTRRGGVRLESSVAVGAVPIPCLGFPYHSTSFSIPLGFCRDSALQFTLTEAISLRQGDCATGAGLVRAEGTTVPRRKTERGSELWAWAWGAAVPGIGLSPQRSVWLAACASLAAGSGWAHLHAPSCSLPSGPALLRVTSLLCPHGVAERAAPSAAVGPAGNLHGDVLGVLMGRPLPL